MTPLDYSVLLNIASIILLIYAISQWSHWQASYEELRITANLIRNGGVSDGQKEVLDRWNTYLRARLDLAAGLNEDVSDLLKDEEEDE